jgi:hypothetical protein
VSAVESLGPSFERLIGMVPVGAGRFPATMPGQGVYTFNRG